MAKLIIEGVELAPAFTVASKEDAILSERLLVEAAARGDVKTVTELLQLGVNVEAKNYNETLCDVSKNYMTPLQIACFYDHVCCASLLIANGANKNAKNGFDITAMHIAAEKGHSSCLQLLINANAKCSVPSKYSEKGCHTDSPYPGGTTPLHLAAHKNHVECVKKLIQYGGDYNAVDEFGRTSLYIAALRCYSDCVLVHLRYAVGRDILSLPSKESGDTPLHFAVKEGMMECIEELLKSGSSVNHLNNDGYSPLHFALFSDRIPKFVSRFLSIFDNDMSISTMDSESVAKPTKEILEMLVLKGFNTDINLPTQSIGNHLTPLHFVCHSGTRRFRRPELMKFLISYGANVNIIIEQTFLNSSYGFFFKDIKKLSLLEFELGVPFKDFDALRYIVRSLLHPPRLSKLGVTPFLPSSQPQAVLPSGYVLSENELVCWRIMSQSYKPTVWNDPAFSNYFDFEEDDDLTEPEGTNCDHKHIWYETIASNPRTLQHYCRYAVRKALGPTSIRNIKHLPLPKTVQSYLLLEYGD